MAWIQDGIDNAEEGTDMLTAIRTTIQIVFSFLSVFRPPPSVMQVFLCDRARYPCTGVSLEGKFGTKKPDNEGRITLPAKYLGSTVKVFADSTSRLLLTTKLEKTGEDSIIVIVVL
jgi:hypothetical protein